jgi:hypothetical protein
MDRDPIADARALVAERYPGALAAYLGGGVLSAHRTATSDLDIVVVLTGPPAPFRESLRWRGWPVELFVHDRESIETFFGRDAAARKPTLARMTAEGVPLAGRAETVAAIRDRARSLLAAGPPELTAEELDRRRYGLTDLLDDLAGSADPGETSVIGWTAWTQTAELALLLAGSWLGSGKWLLRELRAADPALAADLLAAIGDPDRLTAVTDQVLTRAGGRLFEGYRAAGRRG